MNPSTDISAYIVPTTGTVPSSAAATVNGSAIDRTGKDSCDLFGSTGAATGTPTAQTFDAKVQDSADGSTGWADLTGAALTQITADNTSGRKAVNLRGAKKWIRVVSTVGFTGGTSPTWPSAAMVVLGGADVLPAV